MPIRATGQTTSSELGMFSVNKNPMPKAIIIAHIGFLKLCLAPRYKPQAISHIGQLKSHAGMKKKLNCCINKMPPITNIIMPAIVRPLRGLPGLSMIVSIVLNFNCYPKLR